MNKCTTFNRISQRTIDEVCSLPILEVVGKFYNEPLKPSGSNFRAKSPWTDERTPSFYVVPAKNIFKDFSSGRGGGPVHFVMEKAGLSFPQAIVQIAEAFNIGIEADSNGYDPKEKEFTEQLYTINRATARRYAELFWEMKYDDPHFEMVYQEIDRRGFTEDTLLQWGIGYSPDSWDYLYQTLKNKGLYSHGIELGLIRTKGERSYDTFRHRLMFPILDETGQIVAFGGRYLPGAIESNVQGQDKPAKYLNSPESSIYKKSRVLYGLHFAIHEIRKQGFARLTEGYTDVISMHQAGFENTVGTCGTSLTKEQVQLLKRYTNKVVLLFDGDAAGNKAARRSLGMFMQHDFEVQVCTLPNGKDPDDFLRDFDIMNTLSETTYATPEDYFRANQKDGVLWLADEILTGIDNPIKRNEAFEEVAQTIALVNKPVAREDYTVRIAKAYNLQPAVLRKMVDEATALCRLQTEQKRVRKNKVVTLDNPRTFPFFHESFTKSEELKIVINKVKFTQLLSSFGYSRYEIGDNDSYTFVKIEDSVIKTVKSDQIIDHLETFLRKEYDFEAVGCREVDAETLINKFYDGINTYFSNKIFARVRTEAPIIINRDKATITYLYFENGFVEISDKGYELKPYTEMDGSVWDHQIIPRKFEKLEQGGAQLICEDNDKDQKNFDSDFADFVWKISGRDSQRFLSLCCIIGYLLHDYYNYTLKAVYFTDSTISDHSQGRTGKTLLLKMLGTVRSFVEIPGKNFNPYDEKKYQTVKLGTQLVHINDVSSKGRNAFEFEPMFNDVTEGLHVRALYTPPFNQYCKLAISGNRTLNLQGDSAKGRITEFEMSDFFNLTRTPRQYYGRWLGDDWDDVEWSRFDNFICYCVNQFHKHGLMEPPTINLGERKLRDHTAPEFIEFMDDKIGTQGSKITLNRNNLYTEFKQGYRDFEKMSSRKFADWCRKFAEYRGYDYGEQHSGSTYFIVLTRHA